jgi:hypothetical protein
MPGSPPQRYFITGLLDGDPAGPREVFPHEVFPHPKNIEMALEMLGVTTLTAANAFTVSLDSWLPAATKWTADEPETWFRRPRSRA